tara:strand:- start:8646 stop:8969 length:324 start_codon:yes stop_codon:yes gene_type:complete
MGKKFEELIDVLDYDELIRFKKDLDDKGIALKKLVQEKIKARLKEHEKSCASCSNDLEFYKTNNYTLVFGPDDFKKKASFCGMDCLEYFLINLKQMRRCKENAEKIE